MTHSVTTPPRKPRRLGLWIPWGAALILAIGWSGWWLWLRGETEHQIDAAAAGLRAHGGQASWATRQIGGYPFRLDVDFTDLKLAGASGWAISLPTLKSEAYAFAPTRWIVATRDGATLTEPGAAPLTIASPVMRASLNSWDQHPPRFSFVGDDLSFAFGAGAPPFPLARAKSVQFYTKAGPDDQGAMLFEITGGAATAGTDLGQLAGGQPVGLDRGRHLLPRQRAGRAGRPNRRAGLGSRRRDDDFAAHLDLRRRRDHPGRRRRRVRRRRRRAGWRARRRRPWPAQERLRRPNWTPMTAPCGWGRSRSLHRRASSEPAGGVRGGRAACKAQPP